VRAPGFWNSEGLLPSLLTPAAALYNAIARMRRKRARPWRAPAPVICIGNLVAGGAGKTPVARSVCARLADKGCHAHLVSRGYGGRETGPLRVDPNRHVSLDVGDEALLLAATAPTWIAGDRAAGARAAIEAGAQAIVLDDGFQNPALEKDLSLLVIDGAYGFGNGRLIPAGPLREPIGEGLARADAAVLIGADRANIAKGLPERLPVLGVQLKPCGGIAEVAGKSVVAFAGIGRPEKFFETLEDLGCELLGRHSFADHHYYRDHEIMVLADKADKLQALLVTTAKDFVRLPDHLRALVAFIEIEVEWDCIGDLDNLLESTLQAD